VRREGVAGGIDADTDRTPANINAFKFFFFRACTRSPCSRSLDGMKTITSISYQAFALFAFTCIATTPLARAQCREGCDSNTYLGTDTLIFNTTGYNNTAIGNGALNFNNTGYSNTAIGANALVNNGSGYFNTATGDSALYYNDTGNANTATGYFALTTNTTGSSNTATGYFALRFNHTGNNNTANGSNALYVNSGDNNAATGAYALFTNTTGNNNTANGYQALYFNTTGNNNTANGSAALYNNTTGFSNTANGVNALIGNTTGTTNTAIGVNTLYSNTGGLQNTAIGDSALYNNTGNNNTATGVNALISNTTGTNNTANGNSALFNNTTGASNIALGYLAGQNLTTGSNNIDIGNLGVGAESNKLRIGTKGAQKATFIAGISGVTVANGVGVIINTQGQLGTVVSSARYKDDIRPMDKTSEAVMSLKPVTFRYKKELDPKAIPQFGLVAEDVAKVDPDLVAKDDEGKPYTVRYEAVNAMLLNEFLKEHKKVEDQAKKISELESAMKLQSEQMQDVTARLKANGL